MIRRTGRTLAGLQLADILCRNWLVLLLRGLMAVGFGGWVFRTQLNAIVLPFCTYALADGVLGVGISIGEYTGDGRWWALFGWGLAGIGIGVLTFLSPSMNRLRLMCYIALWAATTGVLVAMTAVFLRGKLGAEWLLVLAGLISVVFGISVVALSGTGPFMLSRMIAGYYVVFGIILGMLALRARAVNLPAA